MDNLERLRTAVRKQLDLQRKIAELKEEETQLARQLTHLQMEELPDMFAEANVDRVGLAAEGNQPAYDAILRPYYKAGLPKDNPGPGLAWLDKEGHGDIIKTVISIRLGRGDRETAKEIEDFLRSLDVDFSTELGVPWNTLTAFVREQTEKYGKCPPLDILGAVVGQIVILKERKD